MIENHDKEGNIGLSPSKEGEDKGENTQGLQENTRQHRTESLEKTVSLPREILIVAIICLSQFTTQVGLGQMLVILKVVSDSFHIKNPGTDAWLIAGYSLTIGTFILVSGRLGDVLGYKRMLVIGYAWFALWSLVAGLSVYSNYILFVFARVLQGIGPSICLPNGLALLGILYEQGQRKNMAFALFGACAPSGSIIGALFAALFTMAWWPWTFFSFAITLTVISVGAVTLIPDPQVLPPWPKTVGSWIRLLDAPAAMVGVLALILVNFAWNQAPLVGWNSPYVCVCLVLGILCVPLFFYLETKVASSPLIPFSALNSTNASVLSIIAAAWASFGIMIYYIFQILQVLRGASPILTVAYLSPVVVGGLGAGLLTGVLLSYLRPAWLMVIATSMFLTANILLATLPPHQVYWAQIFVLTIVAPFGMDMSFPAATIYLSNTIEKERQGVAASLVITIVNYSISLGLGFAGTIEVNINPGGTSPRDLLRGYRAAVYMGVGFAGLGLCLSVLFLCKTYWDDRRRQKIERDPESEGNREAISSDRPDRS